MTSLPRLNVVNALLAEWLEKRAPLTRHRLQKADPNTKEDLELYLNYVEMLKAEEAEHGVRPYLCIAEPKLT